MKNDDEFALKNEEYDDNARAVNESELLPIFEAMEYSGDIQPLEDFEIPEPVATELQLKKKPEGKISETKELIKKKIPFISGLNINKKPLIIALVSLLAVICAIVGINKYIDSLKNENPVGMIYSSEKTTFVRLDNDKCYELEGVNEVKVSADGMKLFYSVNTQSKVGKYDIRYIDASKRDELKNGGKLVCNGIDDGWSVNSDGCFLCYSTTVSKVKQSFMFSVEDFKSKQLPAGVEEMFLPSSGDVLYFTRKNGSIYSLHRMRYGEEAESIASGISHVKFCDSEDGFEVIYTVEAGIQNTFNVYSVKGFEQPSQICSDAGEVYLDDYVYGGNLYYFKPSDAAIDWHDFVNDPYFESDMTLEHPVESDYMIEYGFIIKRYVLDRNAYDNAVARYEEKLARDSIREELDKMDFGLDFDEEYTCNVYNQYTNRMLATGVALDNVLAFSATGTPRVIIRKSVINADEKFEMDSLVEYAEDRSASRAGDYVLNNMRKSFKTSDDCVYAWFDGSNVITNLITDCSEKDTQFFLSSGLPFYSLNSGKLYFTNVSGNSAAPRMPVAENVSECEVSGEYIYYKKLISGENYSLNRYGASGEQKLSENIIDYIAVGDDVLMFTQGGAKGSVTVSSRVDGEYREIASDIIMEHFIRNGSTAAYISRSNSKIANAGDLYVLTFGGSPKKCEGDVTEIKYIKDQFVLSDNKSKA